MIHKQCEHCKGHLKIDDVYYPFTVCQKCFYVIRKFQWIGVNDKDRLPKKNCFCIICWEIDDKIVVSQGYWSGSEFSVPCVTHWMPLPEPPEVE